MRHLSFTNPPSDTYKTALLIKTSYFHQDKIEQWYIDPLEKLGIDRKDIVAFDLEYTNNKVTASQAKKYLASLLQALTGLGVSTIMVADSAYFKALTGLNKAESHIGYIHPCKIKDYEHIHVCYAINYAVFMRNPNQVPKLDLALDTLANHLLGNTLQLGENIIHHAEYFELYYNDHETYQAFEVALNKLHQHPTLVCDIETYGLDLESAGLGSIAFAWSKHEGIAALTIYDPKISDTLSPKTRELLKRFFESYKGTLIFHNCTFDIKHLIFTLFMDHPEDHRGMLHGLHTLFRNTHDTKVIAYLATNSTSGNELGLKPLAHPYTGNYGLDVTDIGQLSVSQLLQYNLKDCLATYWVFEKYYPIMLKDKQKDIYDNIMMPSAKLITQMELVGMPIDMPQVEKTEEELEGLTKIAQDFILANPYVAKATHALKLLELVSINSKLKSKVHGMDKVADFQFNPASSKQLGLLLYEVLELPVLDTTPTGSPATGAKTIEKLLNHTDDSDVIDLLNAIIDLGKVSIILSTFIPAFKKAFAKGNWHYLHGNFNLGGTLSGRLSSSNPNLQNIPSGSTYGAAIKKCFRAPKGWVFCGADFASLEDRINALLTKDPNKLAVYTSIKSYEIIHNGTTYCFDGDSIIEYSGKLITVKDYYEAHCVL